MSERMNFSRHPDDRGIDEVLLVEGAGVPNTVDEARSRAILKIGLIERYKTSGLSGDEWRFSAGLYLRGAVRWDLISHQTGSLEGECASLYAELFGDFCAGKRPSLYSKKIGAVTFQWKGHPIYSASYDVRAVDLLVACGHVPWALLLAGDQGCDPEPLKRLCCQPGCAEPLVSIYKIRKCYCQSGHPSEPLGLDVRGFCAKHLRRGDCGLDDADANYEVVSGPGPDGNEPDSRVVKSSVFIGDLGDVGNRKT